MTAEPTLQALQQARDSLVGTMLALDAYIKFYGSMEPGHDTLVPAAESAIASADAALARIVPAAPAVPQPTDEQIEQACRAKFPGWDNPRHFGEYAKTLHRNEARATWQPSALPAVPASASVAIPVDVLRQHWIRVMECDGERERNKPHCACSRVDLGWHPNMVEASEAWLAHVLEAAGAPSQPASASVATDLHARVVNLSCTFPPDFENDFERECYQVGHRDARHAAAELVSASVAAPVPLRMAKPGWKLVPVEPTREIIAAMRFTSATGVHNGDRCLGIEGAMDAYRAMLAAAPSGGSEGAPAEGVAQLWAGEAFKREGVVCGRCGCDDLMFTAPKCGAGNPADQTAAECDTGNMLLDRLMAHRFGTGQWPDNWMAVRDLLIQAQRLAASPSEGSAGDAPTSTEMGKRSISAATASSHEFPDAKAPEQGQHVAVANWGGARVASAGCARPCSVAVDTPASPAGTAVPGMTQEKN